MTLLAERGLDAFSVGAVARWMGQTPQAVLKYAGGRDRFVAMVTDCFAQRWLAWSTFPEALPTTADERYAVRLWLALTELARGELLAGRTEPAESLAHACERERWVMRARLELHAGRQPTDDEVDTALALIYGLRVLMSAPAEPLAAARAEALLSGWLSTTNLDGEVPGDDSAEAH